MYWESLPFVFPLLIAAAVTLALVQYARSRRPAPGITAFMWLMLAVAEWSVAYALELGSTNLAHKVFWAKVEYLGVATVPLAWLVMVLQYVGLEKRLTRRNLVLLAVLPAITLVQVWTNESHGLMWSHVSLNDNGYLSTLDWSRGAWFWVYVTYAYLLLLMGAALVTRWLLRSSFLYRGQAIVLLLGLLVPWAGNVLYVSGVTRSIPLDLTPFGFTLTSIGVVWGLFRFRLLDIVPVARDAVVENMGDGTIVLDAQKRIVDLNPAAQRIICNTASEVIGKTVSSVLTGWPDLLDADPKESGMHTEIFLNNGHGRRCYDLRISPLKDRRDQLTGQLLLLRDITEHKRTEEALREAHERLSATLDALPDLLFEVDHQGTIHDFRSPRPELLYAAPEEFLGKRVDQVLPQEVANAIDGALSEAIKTGRHTGTSYSLDTPAGVGWFELSVSVKGDPKSPEGRLIVLVHDVTERKRAEEALKESEARYRGLFNGVPLGLYCSTPDGQILEANSALAHMLGYPDRESFLACNAVDLYLNPEDRERWREVIAREGVVREFEVQLIRRDGTPIWVADNARATQDFSGQILYYEGSLENISGRIQAEEALRQRNRELTTLYEAVMAVRSDLSLDSVLKTVAEQIVRALNVSGCTLSLWNQELNLVETLADFNESSPDGIDSPGKTYDLSQYPATRHVLETCQPVVIQHDDPLADKAELDLMGKYGVYSMLMLPLIARDRVMGLAELMDDGEARNFTPEEMRLALSLASQAAIAIENARLVEELRQYAVELEARNEELDAFAHTAAHDLKNPLAKVVGFCEVIKDGYAEISKEELSSYLYSIARQGRKMSNIVDELLLLAGVGKKEQVHMSPLDMEHIVAEAQERLAYLVEERRAEIILPESWPVALGYGPWVEEVWSNYLSNAIKYGGRPPRVELGATELGNGQVRFWVRDNGLGLTPEEQARIFEPFTRLGQIRVNGHGLGLSIVRRILDRLGGEVGVESQVGHGSVFSFTLRKG